MQILPPFTINTQRFCTNVNKIVCFHFCRLLNQYVLIIHVIFQFRQMQREKILSVISVAALTVLTARLHKTIV